MDEAAASFFALPDALSTEFANALAAGEGFFVGYDMLAEKAGGLPVIDVPLARLTLQLDRKVKAGGREMVLTEWFLGGGDWSAWLRPIATTPVYREVETLLRAGKDYHTTAMYQRLKLHMELGRPPIRNEIPLDTREKLEAYGESVQRLSASIKEQGVIRRSEVSMESMTANSGIARSLWVEAMESEIGAAILGDGTIVRLGPGHHRTAAAKFNRISSLPVEIRLVHSDWLKRQMAETGLEPWPALIEGIHHLSQFPLPEDRPT